MKEKVLVINGNPKRESLCAGLSAEYVRGARERNAAVEELKLADLSFDPVLWEGYDRSQELEPDLIRAQELILWSDHLVFVYPIWWGGMPALMKGFFDRLFLPGFAYKFRKDSMAWDRLLKGRSANLLVLMDTPPWYFRLFYRMPGHHQMKRTILEFCGIRPVQIHSFGPVKRASESRRRDWLAKAYKLGRMA